jgi:hypothetical protein
MDPVIQITKTLVMLDLREHQVEKWENLKKAPLTFYKNCKHLITIETNKFGRNGTIGIFKKIAE